ncbi:MAG: hypothetical protein RQ732_00700, partial [Methylophaga sp.]|nr:hypothetical protein [Methylophaga sp.]
PSHHAAQKITTKDQQPLVTLSQFQADQNKQKQNDQQASSMKWLTTALVAFGIAQVFVAFYGVFTSIF